MSILNREEWAELHEEISKLDYSMGYNQYLCDRIERDLAYLKGETDG